MMTVDAPHPASGRHWVLGVSLTGAMAAGSLMQFVLGALAPYLVQDLDLSDLQIGSLTTTFFVVATVGSLIAGGITDRLGGKHTMLLLFAVAALAFVVMGFAGSYAVLLLAVPLAGIAQALTNPTTNDLVAVHIPAQRRGVYIGLKQSGVQVAALVAGLLVPLLAHLVNWRVALFACTGIVLAALAAAQLGIPGDVRPTVTSAETGSSRGHPDMWWLVAYGVITGVAYASVTAYLPLYAVRDLDMSELSAGQLLAVIGAVGVASRLAWTRLIERADHRTVPVSLTAFAASAVLATALVALAPQAGAWMLWVAALIYGSTIGAWTAIAMLAVVRRRGPWSTARVSGIVVAGYYGGLLLSPVLFGLLVDSGRHYARGWSMSCVLFFAALVTAGWWWQRTRRSDTPLPGCTPSRKDDPACPRT